MQLGWVICFLAVPTTFNLEVKRADPSNLRTNWGLICGSIKARHELVEEMHIHVHLDGLGH
jgi:hypothetical protein